MSTYKELAEHLEAYFKNAHRMDEVIAILCSLDAQPVAEVSVMGSYHGKPILGCVLSNDSMQVGDKLYAVPVAAQPTDLEAMRQQKDGAYFERNQVVAALAKCFPSGVAKTAIEGWSEDWHGCVYIDLPTGQVSWHFHDSQAYLFKDLPPYAGAWDGHDTPEKYRRVNALAAAQPTREQAQRGRMATQWDAKAFDFSRYFAALQRAMRARNASAADVSRATGVSNTTLTRMKEGRRPDAASLAALSAWAGLNPAEYVRASPTTADFDLPAQSDEVAAQASKPLSDEPNMFWNHDDPESPHRGIGEFLNDEWSQNGIAVGDIRRVQRAIRLPDVMVRVTAVSDDGDIDYIVEAVNGIGAQP